MVRIGWYKYIKPGMDYLGYMLLLGLYVSTQVYPIETGECCSSYRDKYNNYKDGFWCSDYCCYEPQTLFANNGHECCDILSRRVYSYDREDTCAYWWSSHGWVPALIAIGCIAAVFACCFGCFKLCCSPNNRTGTVVQQPHPQAAFVIAHSSHPQAPYQPMYQPPSTQIQQTNVSMGMYPPPGPSQVTNPPNVVQPPPYQESAMHNKQRCDNSKVPIKHLT